ncbi:hypothetical protein [Vulcanisaeta sp. JCM 16161]|uniref:hypothetical protein n=1 Tax=Vulcanisaeta sp. JCM 16161 TaxID=1295372 RepID=UPI0006D057ED|nr:hypothetical protein [Vulcanisaeta sp. JCM 16161]
MGKDGEGKDGRVPAVDVTVVGVDVGVRRSVVAFVGVRAGLLNELAVIYARQNGVSLIPLGVYDVMTRAYVAEVEYPGIDKYRGNELTSNIVGKVLGAVIRASHSVQRVRDGLVGLAFEDLRRFSGHKRDLARARVVWEFMVNEFGGVVSRCPAVKVSWFWMSYKAR